MTLALACLLAASVALVLTGPGASPAAAAAGCPGGGSCLRVHLVDDGRETRTVFLSNAQLRGAPYRDLGTTAYRTRTSPGADPQDEPIFDGAVSIRSLVTNVGRNPAAVTYVEIRNPADSSGYVSRLEPGALGEPGANGFESGLQPAFEATSPTDTVNYVRPLRAGDRNDVNGRDLLLTSRAGLLDVVVGTGGQQVEPTITATPTAATVGEAVAFTSDVAGAGYDYAWDFGEGGTATEQTPQHVFATTGTYLVSLRLSGRAYGQSNVLRVVVGAADEPEDGGGPGGPGPGGVGPGGGAGGGPRGDGKGTSQDPYAPTTGPNQDSGGKTGGAAPGPQVTDPGQGGTGQTATDPDSDADQAPQQRQQGKGPAGRRTPAPGDVRGVLLEGGANVVPLGGAESPAATAGQEPTAPTARASGGGGGGLWWGAGLLPVLLLLGAAGETGLGAMLRTRLGRDR